MAEANTDPDTVVGVVVEVVADALERDAEYSVNASSRRVRAR